MIDDKEKDIEPDYVVQIKDYIENKTDYAIILDGPYGVGKTYFVKEILPKVFYSKNHIVGLKRIKNYSIILLCICALLYYLSSSLLSTEFISDILALDISSLKITDAILFLLLGIISFITVSIICIIILIIYYTFQLKIDERYMFIYVSLYGINSISELQLKIKDLSINQILSFLKGDINSNFIISFLIKFYDKIWMIAPSIIDSVEIHKRFKITSTNIIFSFIKFIIELILNVNHKPQIILFIDDVDRKSDLLKLNDLLAFVNNLTENERIKVVLIMNSIYIKESLNDNRESLKKTVPFKIQYNPSEIFVYQSILNIVAQEKASNWIRNYYYFNPLKIIKNIIPHLSVLMLCYLVGLFEIYFVIVISILSICLVISPTILLFLKNGRRVFYKKNVYTKIKQESFVKLMMHDDIVNIVLIKIGVYNNNYRLLKYFFYKYFILSSQVSTYDIKKTYDLELVVQKYFISLTSFLAFKFRGHDLDLNQLKNIIDEENNIIMGQQGIDINNMEEKLGYNYMDLYFQWYKDLGYDKHFITYQLCYDILFKEDSKVIKSTIEELFKYLNNCNANTEDFNNTNTEINSILSKTELPFTNS